LRNIASINGLAGSKRGAENERRFRAGGDADSNA
jgi:hypothetical protein